MEVVRNYRPILKNEVPVYREPMEHLFREYNVYVFGYGSLLYSQGWLGRGMQYPPRRKDLIECLLNGFERGPFGLFDKMAFYGIIRKKGAKCNGVLAPVKNLRDWANLMRTEQAAGITRFVNYRVVDVTEDIGCIVDADRLKKPFKIHAVCNRPINKQHMLEALPYPRYYNRVWLGILKERSEEFAEQFLKTGGFKDQLEVVQHLNKEAGCDDC